MFAARDPVGRRARATRAVDDGDVRRSIGRDGFGIDRDRFGGRRLGGLGTGGRRTIHTVHGDENDGANEHDETEGAGHIDLGRGQRFPYAAVTIR